MMTKRLPIFGWILLLLLAACGPAADNPGEMIPFDSELSNITLMRPENWAITEDADAILIASSADALTNFENEEATFITIALTPGNVATLDTLPQLLQPGTQALLAQEGAELLEEAAVITINNQQASSMTLRSENPAGLTVVVRSVVIAGPDQVAFISAVTDAGRYEADKDVVDAIINSIAVGSVIP